ncbi:SRV-11 protein, partial [Aphelenchoides avenae]
MDMGEETLIFADPMLHEAVLVAQRFINWVSFSFFCITVPFYGFLMIVVVQQCRKRNRDIAHPFYYLTITTGIVDILTLLNNYIGSVFPKWCWFRDAYWTADGFFLHSYFFFAWGTGASQALCTSVIALNRLSAIYLGERYLK